jgi:hypothetical protein
MDGSSQFIDWWSEAPGAESTRVKLELSTTGRSGPWQPVADSLPNAGRRQWLIPHGIVSGSCYIKYTVSGPGGTAEGMTPRAFVIGDTVVGATEPDIHEPRASGFKPASAIVRGVLYLPRDNRVPRPVLLDATGREVLRLHAGPNDVSRLAPGVYFAKTPAGCTQGTLKVVVTR